MSGHTPGPWAITLMGSAMDGDFRYQIGTHAKTVAYTYDGLREPTPEHDANARLIVAAPELLNSLQSAVNNPTDDAYWITQARAAIAKATGEPK